MGDESEEKIEALANCLREHGCVIDSLKVVTIPGAGRGLFASKTIRPCSYIIRLAEDVLITSTTVLQSIVRPAISKHPGILSSSDALCLFLMAENARRSVSPWRPFLDTLPEEDAVLAFSFATDSDNEEEVGQLLPPRCRLKYFEQQREINSCRRRVLKVWRDAKQLLENEFILKLKDEQLFRWAWSCVNSRCIYKENRSPSSLLCNTDGDAVALAPFLDMLNHSPVARGDHGFCSLTRTFDLHTEVGIVEGKQVFICYGSHPNAVLLLEYGFVLKENPNNAVYLEHSDVQRLCTKADIPVSERHWKALNDSKLLCALYETDPEPPWTFMATMQLLSMKEEQLDNWLRIYELTDFDDPDVIQLAKTLLSKYLSELEEARPDEQSLGLLPKRFRPMVIQVWQDDISIVADSLAYLTGL